MKKKARKKFEKDVLAVLDDWTPCLGLEPYEREVAFLRTEEGFGKSKHRVAAARVWCDWRYQTIYIEFCLPVLVRMSIRKRERVIVHELVHALVNPMSKRGKHDAEEFVVTNLTNAFIWTRNRARKGVDDGSA